MRFSTGVVREKSKLLFWPITTEEDNPMDQSEIEQIHAAGAKRGKTNTSYSHDGFSSDL